MLLKTKIFLSILLAMQIFLMVSDSENFNEKNSGKENSNEDNSD